jgi:hypothetical protein
VGRERNASQRTVAPSVARISPCGADEQPRWSSTPSVGRARKGCSARFAQCWRTNLQGLLLLERLCESLARFDTESVASEADFLKVRDGANLVEVRLDGGGIVELELLAEEGVESCG